MRSNVIRWAMLAWALLWLAVVAPGHTRGMIRTDSSREQAKSACCAASQEGSRKPSKDENARHCAICYLNASLDLPLTIDLTPRFCELLDRLQPVMIRAVCPVLPGVPFHGRAPPMVHA